MIETTLLDYLSEKLSVPVYIEKPPNPPAAFVLLEKTGSSKKNHVCSAVFALQSYGETMQAAATINETVKATMENVSTVDTVCAARLNSDYNFTDTSTKKYRYQAVYDITHY